MSFSDLAYFQFNTWQILLNIIIVIQMEEKSQKREQIRTYLKDSVNPVIEPLVKELLKNRPADIIRFISDYAQSKMTQEKPQIHSDDDNDESEQDKEFLKKLEEKKKKKVGKKHSRQGISAQCFGQYNQKAEFKPRIIPKSKQVEEQIRKLVDRSILFQCLSKEDMNTVIGAMEELAATPGQYIIKEGEKGDTLYIVSSGEYDCTKVISGKQTYLKTYKSGESFGELALMYNAPRAATIKCKTSGKMYGMDRSTFTTIIQEAAMKKRKANMDVLKKVDIFQDVDPYEKEQVCDVLVEESYSKGDYIVKQGDSGDKFYIVADGKLIAEKEENGQPAKKVFEYHENDYFGEISLVKNCVRQASIKAETDCRVMSIERDAFKRLLGPIEEILKRNMDKYKKYMQQH